MKNQATKQAMINPCSSCGKSAGIYPPVVNEHGQRSFYQDPATGKTLCRPCYETHVR